MQFKAKHRHKCCHECRHGDIKIISKRKINQVCVAMRHRHDKWPHRRINGVATRCHHDKWPQRRKYGVATTNGHTNGDIEELMVFPRDVAMTHKYRQRRTQSGVEVCISMSPQRQGVVLAPDDVAPVSPQEVAMRLIANLTLFNSDWWGKLRKGPPLGAKMAI